MSMVRTPVSIAVAWMSDGMSYVLFPDFPLNLEIKEAVF